MTTRPPAESPLTGHRSVQSMTTLRWTSWASQQKGQIILGIIAFRWVNKDNSPKHQTAFGAFQFCLAVFVDNCTPFVAA